MILRLGRFWRFVDRFLPLQLRRSPLQERARARVFVLATLMSLVTSAPLAFLPPDPRFFVSGKVVYACTFILAVFMFWRLRRTAQFRSLALVQMFWGLLQAGLSMLVQQSIYTPYYYWLPGIVVFLTFLTGSFYGLLGSALVVCQAVACILILATYGHQLPLGGSFDGLVDAMQIGFVGAGIFTAALLFVSETLRLHAERALQKQMDETAKATNLAAMGELVGNIAHEVNNPLAIIKASILRLHRMPSDSRFLSEDQVRVLDNIRDSVQRIVQVTEGLQIFAKGNAKEAYSMQTVKEIMRQFLVLMQKEADIAGVRLELLDRTAGARIPCRFHQVVHVLRCLGLNSFEALSGQDGGIFSLEAWIEKDDLYLRARDNGPGVIDSYRDRVFLPFFTTRQHRCAQGLGLSVSRGIIEEHGGEILLESVDGGCSMLIRLPLQA